MDTSAREAMKDAAKCDKHCDLQISANQQISERIMRRWGLLYLQAWFSVFEPLMVSMRVWEKSPIAMVLRKSIVPSNILNGIIFKVHVHEEGLRSYGIRRLVCLIS